MLGRTRLLISSAVAAAWSSPSSTAARLRLTLSASRSSQMTLALTSRHELQTPTKTTSRSLRRLRSQSSCVLDSLAPPLRLLAPSSGPHCASTTSGSAMRSFSSNATASSSALAVDGCSPHPRLRALDNSRFDPDHVPERGVYRRVERGTERHAISSKLQPARVTGIATQEARSGPDAAER